VRSPPFQSPTAAYQLHYYLCFRTKRNRPLFNNRLQVSLEQELTAISELCDFHVPESQVQETHVRLLLSLRPEHSVAEAVKNLKGNSSRLLCQQNSEFQPGQIWSRSYFAKSAGKVDQTIVSNYISSQAEHHGYIRKAASLVSAYDEPETAPRLSYHNHAAFNLTHHLVFETDYHTAMFDDFNGKPLIDYWLRVAAKKDFQMGQIRLLPDHCHLKVRLLKDGDA
jgi:putative transposase